MLTVIIPDPALREFGGHHPATIDSLVSSSAFIEGKIKLEVYAHEQCSPNFIDSVQHKNASVSPYFTTDFYQYFYCSPNFTEQQTYIKKLASEYARLLRKLNARACTEELTLWFHTLTWLHAQALTLAIKLTRADLANFKVIIGLMYKPTKQLTNGNVNVQYNVYSKMAFKALAQFNNVWLAAADWELSQEYEQILGQQVNIQPTALLGNAAKCTPSNSENKKQVLLFCGDAKENKGFLALPKIIEQLGLHQDNRDIEFVVQYTLTNDQEKLVKASQLLKQLAHQHKNLHVMERFLSHQELIELFNNTAMILLNYEESTYSQQSSGVLWLAVYFNLQIVSLTSTWCDREAKRLGGQYYLINSLSNLSGNVRKLHRKNDSEYATISGAKNAYYKQLYSDVGYWLLHGT